MTWVAAVDYRRGAEVSIVGQPCRNYGKVEKLRDGVVLGAVADGAQAATRGHLGARTAVRVSLNALRGDPDAVTAMLNGIDSGSADRVFGDVVDAVRDAIRRTAFEEVVPMSELAASLTVFVAGPLGFVAMQIGGGLFVYRPRGGTYDRAFGDRAPAEEDRFLTDTDVLSSVRLDRRRGPIEFLCVASGALRALSLEDADGGPREPFFEPLDRYASIALDDGDVHRGIREFLRSDRLSRGVSDDLTLALCRYVPGRPAVRLDAGSPNIAAK